MMIIAARRCWCYRRPRLQLTMLQVYRQKFAATHGRCRMPTACFDGERFRARAVSPLLRLKRLHFSSPLDARRIRAVGLARSRHAQLSRVFILRFRYRITDCRIARRGQGIEFILSGHLIRRSRDGACRYAGSPRLAYCHYRLRCLRAGRFAATPQARRA